MDISPTIIFGVLFIVGGIDAIITQKITFFRGESDDHPWLTISGWLAVTIGSVLIILGILLLGNT